PARRLLDLVSSANSWPEPRRQLLAIAALDRDLRSLANVRRSPTFRPAAPRDPQRSHSQLQQRRAARVAATGVTAAATVVVARPAQAVATDVEAAKARRSARVVEVARERAQRALAVARALTGEAVRVDRARRAEAAGRAGTRDAGVMAEVAV